MRGVSAAFVPNDPSYGAQWHHAVIESPGAWDITQGNNTVTVAICDMRGNVKSDAVEAVARVLPESETERVYQAIGRRYGIVGHVFNFFSKLRGGTKRTIGLELRAA